MANLDLGKEKRERDADALADFLEREADAAAHLAERCRRENGDDAVEVDEEKTAIGPPSADSEARREDGERLVAAGWKRTQMGDGSIFYQKDGGAWLSDNGQTITGGGGTDDEIAAAMVALAEKKGWAAVAYEGAPSFKRAAMRAALARGLKVVPATAEDAKILAGIMAEMPSIQPVNPQRVTPRKAKP